MREIDIRLRQQQLMQASGQSAPHVYMMISKSIENRLKFLNDTILTFPNSNLNEVIKLLIKADDLIDDAIYEIVSNAKTLMDATDCKLLEKKS